MGGIKLLLTHLMGLVLEKDCVDYALKKVKFNYVLMSQKCIFDFKTKKFKGKFQDNNFLQYKKYLNLISKKVNLKKMVNSTYLKITMSI